MDKRALTCCFTGHRNLPVGKEEEIWRRVYGRLLPLLKQGVRYFGVGGALGFDTLTAEKLLELHEQDQRLRVILVLPFPGYQSRWTPAQQARAAQVMRRVHKIVYCCQMPSREAFLARNRHLVDGSAYCIAYCTRTTVGSAYTLQYARRRGLQVWNVGGTD
jgi:uncharacterized phage-like protein YoqJ